MYVGGNVAKGKIGGSVDYDLWGIPVLPRAHECGVIDGLLDDFGWRSFRADHSDVVLHWRLPKGKVLANEHPYPDTRHVEVV